LGNKAILCSTSNSFLFNIKVYDSQNFLDFSSDLELYGLKNLLFHARGNLVVVANYGLFIIGKNKTINQTQFNRIESCPNSL
jgi:hypothetical protein